MKPFPFFTKSCVYLYQMKQLLFITFYSITLAACSPGKKMTDNNTSEMISTMFDTQGHRGCRGLMPENTIPAMLHALDLGVTTLEMDVVFTKDNIAVLSHEPFFNHEISKVYTLSYSSGYMDVRMEEEKNHNIYKMTFAEMQRYDVGLKPHPRFPLQKKMAVKKPSLSAMFDSVKAYMQTHNRAFPFFNIETKSTPLTDHLFHPAPAAFVDGLMKVIKEKQMEQWVTIQSFDIRTLQYLHTNYPAVPAVLLIEDYDKRSLEDQLQQLGFTPNVYSPHYSLVTKELLEKCHAQKIKVIPWTVNEQSKIESLKAMGVDGIISDYPDLF